MTKTTTPIWKAFTSRMEPISIIRHESTYKMSTGVMRTFNRTWEVDSGGLYESMHFKTKKAAITWAEELIETFDRYRAKGYEMRHGLDAKWLRANHHRPFALARMHMDTLAGKLYDACKIALGGSR
jgi:hypothetical protein